MLWISEFPPRADGGFGFRLSIFFMATFFIVGCYMPYLPLWLKWRGLSDFQISLVYAAPVFIRALFIPAVTFVADKSGRPVRLMVWLASGAFLSVIILPFMEGFAAIFAIILLYTLFWMSVIPVTDAVALAGARAGKADYGRMRLWGSLSFIAMTVGGGAAIDLWGPAVAVWLLIGAVLFVLIASSWLPGDDAIRVMLDGTGLPRPKPRLADMIRLTGNVQLWLFLAATGAIQSAHAVYYIFGTLHWKALGISPTVIGALWAIGVIAEIVLFAYAAQVNRRFSPVQLIALAGLAAVIRWTITAYDPPLAALFLVQALHGLTFGAAHIGAMQFLTRAIPAPLAASAQGLYASVTASTAMGLAALAAGPLYRMFAGGAYIAMAALGLAGLLVALVLIRRWQGGLIVGADEQESTAA